jgi:hypothetical protein
MSENAIDSEKRGQDGTLGSALFCTNSASATMRFCQNSKVFLNRVPAFATAETTGAPGYCPGAAVSDQAPSRPSRRQAQIHQGSPALQAVSVDIISRSRCTPPIRLSPSGSIRAAFAAPPNI